MENLLEYLSKNTKVFNKQDTEGTKNSWSIMIAEIDEGVTIIIDTKNMKLTDTFFNPKEYFGNDSIEDSLDTIHGSRYTPISKLIELDYQDEKYISITLTDDLTGCVLMSNDIRDITDNIGDLYNEKYYKYKSWSEIKDIDGTVKNLIKHNIH